MEINSQYKFVFFLTEMTFIASTVGCYWKKTNPKEF